jgi:hypothetical protein
MTPTGFETVDATSISDKDLRHPPIQGAAESGAFDTDLQVLIKAWPSLPGAVRMNIVATVKAALC